ncbi:hypothetical protein CRG98_031659 [Punica granatum]|uniref:Thioredoxin-like protein AAED1, chloroplastic n=1 Tax=Punica granatum TaxID=22663 RepID=A0A2I0IV42_PUNGR|nr:hypothetical protein CRG98_031659 [Punica granatum]
MAASSLSSTLLFSSSLSLPVRRGRNHVSGSVLLPAWSSAGCSQAWLSSSSEKPFGSIRLSSSPRSHIFAASAVTGSTADVETSAVGEDTTEVLDKVEVFDLNGNAVPISDLWKDRKAVVAFARHFGKRADYLASKKDRMDASGVALVLIGPGSIDQAKAFVEQTKFKGGYRQDWKLSFEKDTVSRGGWQQGGIIVAGPGKKNISYIHRDKEAGDDPDIEEVLAACCS